MAPAAVGRAQPHGQKRPAEDELEGEQRLTKKLGRLHIGVAATVKGPHAGDSRNGLSVSSSSSSNGHATPLGRPAERNIRDDDAMLLDDTKTTVYIHDLESEIAAIEADEEARKRTIEFIPEIEKKINGIPHRVLRDRGPEADENNQLVLYGEPAALSIPVEQDSVRKAIAEARQRARLKSALEANTTRDLQKIEHEPIRLSFSENTPGFDIGSPDAMDID